jgi:hypothetical protein
MEIKEHTPIPSQSGSNIPSNAIRSMCETLTALDPTLVLVVGKVICANVHDFILAALFACSNQLLIIF